MDELIFGFADIFPAESIEQSSTARRNYTHADILEAAGVQITLPKQI